ncbi:MAG: beta-galactosidase trimerization domain-containing protein [Oscillospiraceae bacterium]|nr:beta-galactosidase trimerization domain-containing protein [Oscillospiraceae bacterium]
MDNWWIDIPWRQIQTNLRQIDMEDIDAVEYVRQLQKFHATSVMINTGGIIASYETSLPHHFQSEYLHGDSLKKIIEECHGAGIRVIARTDFSKIRRPIYEQHPDWAYRTDKGEIIDYNGDVHACICGGYQQKYAFLTIREICETLDIDGFFINMGGFQTRDYSHRGYSLCHCAGCTARFREMTGLGIPGAADMRDPAYRKYRAFQNAVMDDYNKRLVALIKSIKPHVAINEHDFFRMESNTEYRRPLPFWQYSASSNTRCMRAGDLDHLASNTSVDFVGFFYRHIAVSPEQQGLRMWQNLANIGGLDYYLIGRLDNHQDRSGYGPVREVFDFHKKHEGLYTGLRSNADALLLRSHGWSDAGEERGWIRALTESHILFDEAQERHALTLDLGKYKAVVLPNSEVMSDAMAAKLDAYVEAGGALVATGMPGRYDEVYEERAIPPLRCLGVERVLYERGDMLSAMFSLSDGDKEHFPDFADTDVAFFGDTYIFNEYKDGAAKYMKLIPPQDFGPPERCYAKFSSELPGVVVNAFGKGNGIINSNSNGKGNDSSNGNGNGKAVYIPSLVGDLYYREGYANTFWLMKGALMNLAGLASVAPGLSEMVEVTYSEKKDGSAALLQFVNTSGHFGTSFMKPLPVYGATARVRCARKPAGGAVSLTTGEAVPHEWDDGYLTLNIKMIDKFEAVKITFRD